MATHSRIIAIYIFTPVVVFSVEILDRPVGLSESKVHFPRSHDVFPGCRWLEWILQSTIQKSSHRIDSSAVVGILVLDLGNF